MAERVIDSDRFIGGPRPSRALRFGIFGLIAFVFVLWLLIRWGASLLIDYSWWQELGQVKTWVDLYAYSTLPVLAATIVAWIVFLIAHSRGVSFAGGRASDYPLYSRLAMVILLGLSFLVADASIDNWVVLRFIGSRASGNLSGFRDPVFGKPVSFFLFDLPQQQIAWRLLALKKPELRKAIPLPHHHTERARDHFGIESAFVSRGHHLELPTFIRNQTSEDVEPSGRALGICFA